MEEHIEQITNEIKNSFGDDSKFYIPVRTESIKNKKVHNVLFDGYVFVYCLNEAYTRDGVSNLSSRYVRPLVYNRRLQYARDADIENFNNVIDVNIEEHFPEVGTMVKPKEGTFRGMEGTVLAINRETKKVTVVFKKISREVTTEINVMNLEEPQS
jgi:transcription antitermination factor NusG